MAFHPTKSSPAKTGLVPLPLYCFEITTGTELVVLLSHPLLKTMDCHSSGMRAAPTNAYQWQNLLHPSC